MVLPSCSSPLLMVCRWCRGERILRCSSSSRVKCEPCAVRYRRRVRRVFASGHRDSGPERLFLVTLTAPGERQHFLPNGQPCACTPPGGVDLAWWNPLMGTLWSEFMAYLRRLVHEDVQYAVGREVQKRGALHCHAIVRCRKDLTSPKRKRQLRRIAMRQLRGRPGFNFGHEVDVQPIEAEQAANYVVKYVTDEVHHDVDHALPWRKVDLDTGEVIPRRSRIPYRRWSASRSWGLTMRQVVEAQCRWVQSGGAGGAQPARRGAPEAPLDPKTERSTLPEGLGLQERVSVLSELS
jgi:hypothetical protein